MIQTIKEYFHKKKHWIYRNIYYRLPARSFYIFPKLIASMWYAYLTGKLPNLRHPNNVNELWIALNLKARKNKNERDLRIRCTDKYAVRQYVAEKGFEQILNEIYGVYDSFEEINFDKLPNQFVVKLTSCSGMNFICKDKNKLDINQLSEIISKWFEDSKEFGLRTAEWHYVEIKPRIVIEKYLSMLGESLSLIDYKFHCFNGQISHIETIYDRNAQLGTINCDAYTTDWKLSDFVLPSYHINRRHLPKPLNFERMKVIAETLSKDFAYVRVDLYEVEDQVIFGELTFTPSGCIDLSYTKEALIKMNSLYFATKK